MTIGVTMLTLALTVGLWASFDYAAGGMQFVDRVPLPGGFFQYAVGVDGISLPLVSLTAFLVPLCVLVSWQVDKTKPFIAAHPSRGTRRDRRVYGHGCLLVFTLLGSRDDSDVVIS